jgi:tight adherence protein C
MPASGTITLVSFLISGGSLLTLLFLLTGNRRSRLETRLDELSASEKSEIPGDAVAEFARKALPRMGAPLVPKDEESRTKLQTRLMHAGFYSRQAMVLFLGVKMLLIVSPAVLGVGLAMTGLVAPTVALLVGCTLGLAGMVAPGFWLDMRKAERQSGFRRALPDALDVLVICLEGGLSLPGAMRRVGSELRTAHPYLAAELNIVQREVQLGMSSGEALRQFGERSDLEEVRSLASVIIQAERFGASLVKALRVHAETLRGKRLQYAEEMAQKAATKILFPTVLFILPCVFVVILAPAVIQIVAMIDNMQK